MFDATHTLEIKRRFSAPRDVVFRLWTTPSEIVKWHCGRLTHAEVDLKVGGKFKYVFSPQGGRNLEVSGRYQEIRAPEKLVYSFEWNGDGDETLVTVTFAAMGDSTEVTLRHDNRTSDDQRNHGIGWNLSFAGIDAYINELTMQTQTMRA